MAVFVDITGRKFGKLRVIDRQGSSTHRAARWTVECDCGSRKIMDGTAIKRYQSCGCARGRTNDLTGKRFGHLTVIGPNGFSKSGNIRWSTLCDCGNNHVVVGYVLNRGHSTSCGCQTKIKVKGRRRYCKPEGVAARNSVFNQYRGAARRRGIEWDLNQTTFEETTAKNCYYCGKSPANTVKNPRYNGGHTYNGVDRKDPTKGYTSENTVPCCTVCNFMKGQMSDADFVAQVLAMAAHLRDHVVDVGH